MEPIWAHRAHPGCTTGSAPQAPPCLLAGSARRALRRVSPRFPRRIYAPGVTPLRLVARFVRQASRRLTSSPCHQELLRLASRSHRASSRRSLTPGAATPLWVERRREGAKEKLVERSFERGHWRLAAGRGGRRREGGGREEK